ncbi:MAG: chorismate synthase [Actinobacteria bacterium]|nr:chorismate synthase [Actinomycetota bacterium]
MSYLRFLSAGESHGKYLTGIIDQYPSGVYIDTGFLNMELSRRQKGYGRGGRMSIEKDKVEVLSGIRNGKSTGSPISFLIRNRDWENWKEIMSVKKEIESSRAEKPVLNPRPGHADLPGILKYRLDSIRDVIERSSARETAVRVCTGGIAKIALKTLGISIYSYVTGIGSVVLKNIINGVDSRILDAIESSPVRCPDNSASEKMAGVIEKAIKEGDSLGGKFKIVVTGVPPGIGSYIQWDMRIDSRLAQAIMSIPAIKAVEIGDGAISGSRTGTSFHDEIFYSREKGFYRKTNRAGGIEGGMSNGENIVIGAVMKPIPTTSTGMNTVDIKSKKSRTSLKERSDVCAVPSASVVGEAVTAVVILSCIQEKFGWDNIEEILENLKCYRKYVENI